MVVLSIPLPLHALARANIVNRTWLNLLPFLDQGYYTANTIERLSAITRDRELFLPTLNLDVYFCSM